MPDLIELLRVISIIKASVGRIHIELFVFFCSVCNVVDKKVHSDQSKYEVES